MQTALHTLHSSNLYADHTMGAALNRVCAKLVRTAPTYSTNKSQIERLGASGCSSVGSYAFQSRCKERLGDPALQSGAEHVLSSLLLLTCNRPDNFSLIGVYYI